MNEKGIDGTPCPASQKENDYEPKNEKKQKLPDPICNTKSYSVNYMFFSMVRFT